MTSVSPKYLSLTMIGSSMVFANVNVAIGILLLANAVFHGVMPLAFVLVSVGKDLNPIALLERVLPLTDIGLRILMPLALSIS